jgi:hypothetical protein
MQKISCPSCGAEVAFRSAASVMAVCEYCQSTLLKDAESVKNIGKMSDVLEDFSPLQITTSGVFQGRNFSLVGRIQLRYDAGLWNEWYALFDDGSAGWLSDASGQYVLTIEDKLDGDAPVFEGIRPGMPLRHRGATVFASDVRTARCVAGQGELPIRVGDGWQAKVADFRGGHRFLTLDYSDGTVPQLYAGQAVTLEGMRCQLLRSDDGVAQTANRFRGKIEALDCPSCGSSIKYVKGMASHLLCPSCHAQVDCSTDKVQVFRKADELDEIVTSAALGDVATINGSKYEVIGLMQCGTTIGGESWTWVEYLLFNPNKGFVWLVESNDGWDSVAVLNEWPSFAGGNVNLNGDSYGKSDEYDAHVLYAAGAFNWRVSVGDRTHVVEYTRGGRTLTSESNANEIVWSAGRRVQPAQIAQWFGKKGMAGAGAGPSATIDNASSSNSPFRAAWIFTVALVVLNLPIAIASGFPGVRITVTGLVVLWLPALIMRYFGKDSDANP